MNTANCSEIVVKTFNTEREMSEWLADKNSVQSFRIEMKDKHGSHSAVLDLINKQIKITLKP